MDSNLVWINELRVLGKLNATLLELEFLVLINSSSTVLHNPFWLLLSSAFLAFW